MANWAITTTFPPLKDIGLGVAYGIYAAFALLSFVFVRILITETRGAELEDMPEDIHASTMHPGIPVLPGARPVSARARGAG